MSAAVLRTALRARAALVRQSVKPAASQVAVQSALVRCKTTSGPRKGKGDDDLYDPYKLYQEEHGKPGYREFNPDLLGDDMDEFEWEEREELMADKSWPMTSGTDMFTDLINVTSEPPSDDKMELILKEFYRRIEHKPLNEIDLPEMSVTIDEENPNKEALEIMKLSLMNNGRISMDDKDEILASIVDELQHLRKDKTTLFKGME